MTQLTFDMIRHRRSHYCTVQGSPRLQRALALLMDGQPHTSIEIRDYANVTSVSCCVDELRKNGYNIPKAEFVRTTDTGARVYVYQLKKGG